ncbi:MAG: hypothetical protein LUH14_01400 [Clostridiaceae bacterium]|nr:hypothetical protein [Clostridiaceae bacterium]
MKWWKRLIFSVISLILGFVSLDYLIYAFRLLTGTQNAAGEYHIEENVLWQLLGAGLFILWFVILAFYYYLLRRSSNRIDWIERDRKTGEERVRRKWFDIMFQAALLLTGIFLRWCYLMFIYFPEC